MRIAIDARSLEGGRTGVGRYLENLLRQWKDNPHAEFLLYFKEEVPAEDFLQGKNFVLRTLKGPLGLRSNFLFQHLLLPYNLLRDKADFFFSPFYLRPFLCPVPAAIVLHDISYEAHPEWFGRTEQFVLRTLSKISARKADLIFTVSQYSKGEIQSRYGTAGEKIVVTPLAPSAGFRRTEEAVRLGAVKEKLGLDRFVLSVGTVFTRRHLPEILAAFERYASRYTEHQLCIVGRNKTFPFVDIDAQIARLNEQLGRRAVVRIDFAPEEELQALYSAAEAAIYLSDYEGFGLPVVEAQYFGLPVITSRNTSLIEVGGDSVEFAEKNEPEEIGRCLEEVLGRPERRSELIEKGKGNLRRFSWEKCAERTLEGIINKR
jgi:glycosyltransferase involved in cell wall biosynthesis